MGETIANEFDIAEEEIKKVKKRFNLEAAVADLKKRQDLYNKSNDTITGLFDSINANYNCMAITIPEDKKKSLPKKSRLLKQNLKYADASRRLLPRLRSLLILSPSLTRT